MSQIEQKEVQTKMEVLSVFNDLTTAPFGAVILYKLTYLDTRGMEKVVIVASFDDGNIELPWGVGIDSTDALQSASREYSRFFRGSPEKRRNPFREVLRG